jgi:GTP cyclohydrolase II
MFQLLGVKSVNLITNNPAKVEGLREFGVDVRARTPIQAVPNSYNRFYLQTKKRKSGHILAI